MSVKHLWEEIAAVTDEEIARAELSQEEGGERVGERVTDKFLKQIATLFYRGEASAIRFCTDATDELSSEEFAKEWSESMRVVLLGHLLDYELAMRYGRYLSRADLMRRALLEVREGWLVYKVFYDETQDDEPLDDERPPLLN